MVSGVAHTHGLYMVTSVAVLSSKLRLPRAVVDKTLAARLGTFLVWGSAGAVIHAHRARDVLEQQADRGVSRWQAGEGRRARMLSVCLPLVGVLRFGCHNKTAALHSRKHGDLSTSRPGVVLSTPSAVFQGDGGCEAGTKMLGRRVCGDGSGGRQAKGTCVVVWWWWWWWAKWMPQVPSQTGQVPCVVAASTSTSTGTSPPQASPAVLCHNAPLRTRLPAHSTRLPPAPGHILFRLPISGRKKQSSNGKKKKLG